MEDGMKRFTVVLLLTLVTAGAMFANGAQENQAPAAQPGQGPGAGPGQGMGPGQAPPPPTEETVSLTGTVKVSVFPPVLIADGVEYKIMVPPWAASNISIKDGQEITLEGFLHNGHFGRYAAETAEENVLMVTKAIIDGEEYVLDMPGPYDDHHGGRGDMMAGRPKGRR